MVTGSVAGVIYGEPRVTHDVDIVLVLKPGPSIDRFAREFPLEEFYCPPGELIHHETGFRADIYLAQRDPLHLWALGERRSIEVDGEPVWVAPVEYVVIRKLEFFREGGSEKHLRDIEGILRVSADLVRKPVIEDWVGRLGLGQEWARVRDGDW